jgi:hypothetical protein
MQSNSEHKACSKCGESKPLSDFHFRKDHNAHRADCKVCFRKRQSDYQERNKSERKKYNAEYREKNKESIRIKGKEWRDKNGDYIKSYHKDLYENNKDVLNAKKKEYYKKNRDYFVGLNRKYYQKNKAKHAVDREKYALANKDRLRAARRKWENDRLKNDLHYAMAKGLRRRINIALKRVGKKNKPTEELIGCTIEELIKHLESQFTDGMTWENYGLHGWHIDHRVPLSYFNLANPNCAKMAFSYKNMQPLWGVDNIKKNNKRLDVFTY